MQQEQIFQLSVYPYVCADSQILTTNYPYVYPYVMCILSVCIMALWYENMAF